MMSTNVVVSPLTNQASVSLLEDVSVAKLITDWRNYMGIDVSREFRGNERIGLYQCNETGLRFFVPATVSGGEDLYAQLQKFDWFYMPWKWEHQVLFGRLNRGERILEVGCATGAFVEKLFAAGFQVKGIEFNSSAVSAAQSKGLPVSAIDLRELVKREGATFDVVCSFQVLEHVPVPATFISDSIAMLKSGGRLVICVPNNDSFLRYQYNLLDMPPHHMTQWSLVTFRALQRLFPLSLTCVRYEPLAHYHIDGYLFAHQKRLIAKSGIYRLLLNRLTIPLLRFLLQAGFRHLCRGQSIYVELVKS